MKWLIRISLGLLGVLAIGIYIVLNPPLDAPAGALSYQLYRRGPHAVTHLPISWVDPARPTAANHRFKGRESRELKGEIWLPADREGAPYPLVVYSHGYMSQYKEGDYLLNFLASHGYVAVSVDFPLSNGSAPGGPIISDVVNQPGDISFLIDQMLARSKQTDNLLYGMVDGDRIAAMGLSLGGLTTELTAFDSKSRDPRIRAAISMAGPSDFFTAEFFGTSSIPFMYVGGTADAIVPFPENAQPIPGKYKNGILVTLQSGSHVGFIDMAPTLFRWMNNPDEFGCVGLLHALKNAQQTDKTAARPATLSEILARSGSGIDEKRSTAPCQAREFARAMRPARQHSLVALSIYSFLESQFSPSQTTRQEMREYLFDQLSKENKDVTVRVAS
ncbi:MAG: alpha/beta hydrolase family protein [Steroidobacteraceae bacterium]